MLVALHVDTDRRDEDQTLVHVNAVDLDHQQIEAREIGRHPHLHARCRQRHEAAGAGRFRQISPRRRRNVSLRHHRYLSEFDFRYNNRPKLGVNDGERVSRAIKGAEDKRLTCRPAH